MAIGANSYGSVAEVAALVGRYTSDGSLTEDTRPTLVQVERFIDRVSGVVNLILTEAGFTIPVTQADAVLVMAEFVVEEVIQLCHGANGAGPFAPGSEELRRASPFRIITREAREFINGHAVALVRLGAARPYGGIADGLQIYDTTQDSEDVEPLFDEEDWP